jgi:hypothetical protein
MRIREKWMFKGAIVEYQGFQYYLHDMVIEHGVNTEWVYSVTLRHMRNNQLIENVSPYDIKEVKEEVTA